MAGIYLHIPFCKTRCIYCDFYSTTHNELRTRYIEALCRELEMRRDYLRGEKIETVYLGGGTPSQLDAAHFERLFECLERVYGLDACQEITLEANPDDLTLPYLQMLRRFPFNRISMGIQTFHDETLRLLKRRHTALQAEEAVARCREAGFENISLDLIYGLPGETTERWKSDLQKAISLRPEHFSAYHLTYEEGTPLYQLLLQDRVHEVDEEDSLRFFSLLREELLKAGYEHYEISNFCLPGKHSRHNSSYWKGVPYLGCGPSAHSFNGEQREWNVASIHTYLEGIEQGKRHFETEERDPATAYNELIITALRTQWGFRLDTLKETFGESFHRYCLKMAAPYLADGSLIREGERLRLTEKGIFISDGIMRDLLWVDED